MPEKSFAISEREVEILAHRLLPEIKKFLRMRKSEKNLKSGRLNESITIKRLIR